MKHPYPDIQFKNISFRLSEIEHCYGKKIHILSERYLLSLLSKLCAETTTQPFINELITRIYSSLLETAINQEFPAQYTAVRTRMIQYHAEAIYQGPIIDPDTSVVSVNLARAGTLPSQICYNHLNYLMNPEKIRQDHISVARTTDQEDRVTGSQVSSYKIGGKIDQSIVLFPDPMGATGSTIAKALELYKKTGNAIKYIALHCIITPEYLKKITSEYPDLIVYAIRLDRGLSSPTVLDTVPGTRWDEERGLNDKQYIVPGGGGFGEILNNAYV